MPADNLFSPVVANPATTPGTAAATPAPTAGDVFNGIDYTSYDIANFDQVVNIVDSSGFLAVNDPEAL